MKNGISVSSLDGSVTENISDEMTKFIGECGVKPDYVVMTLDQAEWCVSNLVGKKIKTKQGRLLKFSGLSVIVV